MIAILHLCQSVLLHFFKIKSVSPFTLKIKLKFLSGDFTVLREKGPDAFLIAYYRDWKLSPWLRSAPPWDTRQEAARTALGWGVPSQRVRRERGQRCSPPLAELRLRTGLLRAQEKGQRFLFRAQALLSVYSLIRSVEHALRLFSRGCCENWVNHSPQGRVGNRQRLITPLPRSLYLKETVEFAYCCTHIYNCAFPPSWLSPTLLLSFPQTVSPSSSNPCLSINSGRSSNSAALPWLSPWGTDGPDACRCGLNSALGHLWTPVVELDHTTICTT